MIKFENTNVDGWKAAVRGMRNPLNSWNKSDTIAPELILGEKDLKLMCQLVKAGSDHSKFMRMINVTVDITAPLYWWKEFDTYKVGTVRNSCSTMHTIHKKPFELDDFSHDKLGARAVDVLETIIYYLNTYRNIYIDEQDDAWWWQIIQLLPSSYNQRSTIQASYAALRNMYRARKCHRLDEWRLGFTKWVESLPYSELITMEG